MYIYIYIYAIFNMYVIYAICVYIYVYLLIVYCIFKFFRKKIQKCNNFLMCKTKKDFKLAYKF